MKHLQYFAIVLMLVFPLISAGFQNPLSNFSVWIVKTDANDYNTNLAVQTILDETTYRSTDIEVTTLSKISSIPFDIDVLIIVGHGQTDGFQTTEGIIPWDSLYHDLEKREPKKIIVLACDSPTDISSNAFGFDGIVDARAGAIMIGWYLNQASSPNREIDFPFNRVAKAQMNMEHPLGRYLYLVHGYWGENDGFSKIRDYFRDHNLFKTDYDEASGNVRYFSYFENYNATSQYQKNVAHYLYSISDYANNLFDELIGLPSGSQVNIIGHSLGGIITREMLRLHRSELDAADISISKVITLGTPHAGTNLANPLNNWLQLALTLGSLFPNIDLWPSPVFWSVAPLSPFLYLLNFNPLSYSSGIDWYTISGWDIALSDELFLLHGDISDPIVARGRAHLAFAQQGYFNVGHNTLVDDASNTTYETIIDWITEGPDTDEDGLTDDSEIYYHGTNPSDNDSDDDNLSDYYEVLLGTDPLNWDSDGDGISDDIEDSLGYDPLDATSPIPASDLISSVSVIDSSRTVNVYVNHFSAMNKVKFYVRYKTKTGSWTESYYMGYDSTPTTGGDYYKSWVHPTGYIEMKVTVSAYDSDNNWLGYDYHYRPISDGGGGGGGVPPIE
jgi:pimeloyl-ACP methyl ester carboxylesterase